MAASSSKAWRPGVGVGLAILLALGKLSCGQPADDLPSDVRVALLASRQSAELTPTAPGLRVAFVGDQGLGPAAEAALHLVKNRKADLLLLLGDFDYASSPDAWTALLDRNLGQDLPWLAVVGNHDVDAWEGPQGYAERIRVALGRFPELHCHGMPGRSMSCTFRGLRVVLSDVGSMGPIASASQFVAQELIQSTELWRICAWHKNQRELQVGTKRDEVGWAAYRACQSGGALVVTGHEHSYARTFTLSALGDRTRNHGMLGGRSPVVLGAGKTFVSVIGTGGMSLRPFASALHEREPWWAAYYTLDRELTQGVSRPSTNGEDTSGVLFMEIGGDGEPRRARAWFETARRERVVDRFAIHAE